MRCYTVHPAAGLCAELPAPPAACRSAARHTPRWQPSNLGSSRRLVRCARWTLTLPCCAPSCASRPSSSGMQLAACVVQRRTQWQSVRPWCGQRWHMSMPRGADLQQQKDSLPAPAATIPARRQAPLAVQPLPYLIESSLCCPASCWAAPWRQQQTCWHGCRKWRQRRYSSSMHHRLRLKAAARLQQRLPARLQQPTRPCLQR